jgi:hypothetical protein
MEKMEPVIKILKIQKNPFCAAEKRKKANQISRAEELCKVMNFLNAAHNSFMCKTNLKYVAPLESLGDLYLILKKLNKMKQRMF